MVKALKPNIETTETINKNFFPTGNEQTNCKYLNSVLKVKLNTIKTKLKYNKRS